MKNKKVEKSKASVIKTCIIFLLIITAIFVSARYVTDEEFRDSFDTHILKKQLTESSLGTIEINTDTNPYIFAHDKYINILSKNILTEYTSDGSICGKLDVNISVPLIDSNEKYLVLAEKNGQKIYLISDSNIIWQNKLEGNISKVSVNKNGYVSIILTNTTYKSVIVVLNPEGSELFRTYLSNDYAICTDISPNNKYLAIGEVDYSGTIIKSYVKIISMELAQIKPEDSILHTYTSQNGEIITNIDYEDKDIAVCMFSSYVQKVSHENDEKLYDIKTEDLFIDVNLKNSIAVINKQSSGLFSYEYQMIIKSIENKTENLYILDKDVPKTMIVSKSLIGLNFGNEVQIVNSNGWLVKKYTSSKEIKNIILGNSIAGIVYKNKIEIIEL